MRRLVQLTTGFAFLCLLGSANAYPQKQVPYAIDFTAEDCSEWTALDNSASPGTTWMFKERGMNTNGVYYDCVVLGTDYSGSPSDDYWISPALYLEAGVDYTVETLMSCGFTMAGSQIELSIGTAVDDASTFSKVGDLPVEEGYYNLDTPNIVKVSVEQSGNYYLAYHATSPAFNSETCLLDFKIAGEGGGGTDPEEPVTVNAPYSVDFLSSNEGWAPADNNSDGNTWTYTAGFGVTMNTAIGAAHNDDYVSPGINLTGGKTYKVSTNVVVMAYPNEMNNVQLMQGLNGEALTHLATLDLPTLGNNLGTAFFTPEESGVYHFAFRNLSAAGGTNLGLYAFAIEETTAQPVVGEVVLESDFSGNEPLQGWLTDDTNDDDNCWDVIDGLPGVTYNGNTAIGAADDWLISPSFNVSEGTDYIVEYTFTQAGAFDADVVSVACGGEQNVAAMTDVLKTETYNLGSGTETRSLRMTADRTGTMHIGFHITTSDMNGTMSLVEVRVTTAAKATPMPVTGLEVTSDYVNKTVTLKWTNPSLDTNQTPINETVNIDILENGSLVHTVSGAEPGEEESYVHTPTIPFTGNVTYGVRAVIGSNASQTVEQTVNLDDMQGDTIMVKQFALETQDDFDGWVIEDKNGGSTWNYETWSKTVTIPMSSRTNNDWAITPGVEMETGVRYLLEYDVKTTMNYGADLDVTMGNAQTAASQSTVIMEYVNLKQNGFGSYASPQFSVEESGTYYFGFHAGNVENGMSIKNVRLMYIGGNEELVVIAEFPYSQNFDESTELPEGWRVESGNETFGFQVVNVKDWLGLPDFDAHSTPNALLANSGLMEARDETVFTPMFDLQAGKQYSVSFWLQMPAQNSRTQTLRVYALDAPDKSLATGEPVFELANADVQDWQKQEFMFSATGDNDVCFMISVTCPLSNSGQVVIDDFEVAEYVPEVSPAAPVNLRGGATWPSTMLLNWNYPTEDVEGNPLDENLLVTVKFYDQYGYLGEQTGKPGSFGNVSYDYGYGNPQFAGQLIIKGEAFVGELEGLSSSCVVTVTSLKEGLLHEKAFDLNDTTADDWAIVDGDDDKATWTSVGDTIFTTTGSDEWLFTPAMQLEEGKSYYASCQIETGQGLSVDVEFALASEPQADAELESLIEYEGLELSNYSEIELGRTFTAGSGDTYLAIHASCPDGKVSIKNFKVFRVFAKNEPEPVPYVQDFEDRENVEDITGMTNKWGRLTSSSALFSITTMPEGTLDAHSGEYAAVAAEFSMSGRIETLYTPLFDLEEGGIYEINYWLYMPGNAGRNTYGNVLISPTQSDEGEQLPVVAVMGEPLGEWTKMNFTYTHEMENTPLCFWFYFVAEEANAGIIAIDDFSIEKIGQNGIAQSGADAAAAYYVSSTQTLVTGDACEGVAIFDIQGRMVARQNVSDDTTDLSWLEQGIYVIVLDCGDKGTQTIKIVK